MKQDQDACHRSLYSYQFYLNSNDVSSFCSSSGQRAAATADHRCNGRIRDEDQAMFADTSASLALQSTGLHFDREAVDDVVKEPPPVVLESFDVNLSSMSIQSAPTHDAVSALSVSAKSNICLQNASCFVSDRGPPCAADDDLHLSYAVPEVQRATRPPQARIMSMSRAEISETTSVISTAANDSETVTLPVDGFLAAAANDATDTSPSTMGQVAKSRKSSPEWVVWSLCALSLSLFCVFFICCWWLTGNKLEW